MTLSEDSRDRPSKSKTLIYFYCIFIISGVKKFWTNKMHAFDGVIVMASCYELLYQGGGAATALRAFRLLRIFKLAKKWTSFRILLKAIIFTVLSMGNFGVLLCLMMFAITKTLLE